jgi:hypothetical protein
MGTRIDGEKTGRECRRHGRDSKYESSFGLKILDDTGVDGED